MGRRQFRGGLTVRWWFAVGVLALSSIGPAGFAEVLGPGLAASKLAPEHKGLVLIEELNCVACHMGDASLGARSKKAPRLAEVGSRVNPAYLEAFIRAPHGTKPGTTMPDVLKHLGEAERQQAATALTHFLLSQKRNDFAPQPPDAVAAQHGKRLFHSRGCAQCHSPRDDQGAELLAKSSVPLGALEKKYSFKSLVNFLRQPHASRPSGRMPDLRLQGQDSERIAHYLLQNTRVPGGLAYTLYRGDVWEGLTSDKVKAERAGHVKDFDLESLGKPQQHSAIKYEGWVNLANAVAGLVGTRRSSWQFAQPNLLKCSRPRAASAASTLSGSKAGMGSLEMDSSDNGMGPRGNRGPAISQENFASRPVWK